MSISPDSDKIMLQHFKKTFSPVFNLINAIFLKAMNLRKFIRTVIQALATIKKERSKEEL